MNKTPLLSKLWFWLTTHTDCGWCHRRLHRAWIPLPGKRMTATFRLPRISHGICAECNAKVFAELETLNRKAA